MNIPKRPVLPCDGVLTYVRKVLGVYLAIKVQVCIIACMAKEDDQKDIVEVLVLPPVWGMRRRKAQRSALADGRLTRNGKIVESGKRFLRAEGSCLDGTQSRAETENSEDGPSDKSTATCRNRTVKFLGRQSLAT
jgi:hypothetical protein